MLRLLFSGKESDRGISSFQALAVSLSGRVGTGNIAGVAAAIGFGGPGAVFWMWVVAFLGASTAYVESTLGQIYKEVDEGQLRGGPAYYIEKAMGQKWYAWIFAMSTIIAVGVLLPGVQSNSIGNAANSRSAGETQRSTSSAMRLYTKDDHCRSSSSRSRLHHLRRRKAHRPLHADRRPVHGARLYPDGAWHHYRITSVNCRHFQLILNDAFTPMAGFGAAIGWGVKRGVYSNEAGQGTGPHAAAAAEVEHPAQQGLVQAFSVYVDTLFVCSATAFMILITNQYYVTVSRRRSVAALGSDVIISSPGIHTAGA